MSEPSNSDESLTLTLHLAYAEASVMLLEALMRLLVEREVLAIEDVIEAVETTIETKRVMAQEGTHPEISKVAAGILSTVANSLAAGSAGGGSVRPPHSDEG